MEIKNIIMSKYFELQDRSTYDYILNYSTDSKDFFNIGDFTLLTFGSVKELQDKFTRGVGIKDIIDFINETTGKELKEIGRIKFLDFTKAYNHIKNQIEFINEAEQNGLIGTVDPDAEQAGVDRFDKYGYWMQIDSLSGGDILKHNSIKALSYIDCFTKLRNNVEKSDYETTLNRIKSRRNGKV